MVTVDEQCRCLVRSILLEWKVGDGDEKIGGDAV